MQPTKSNREFKSATTTIKRIGEDIVAAAQRRIDEGKGEEEMDLLSVLLESNTPDGADGQIMSHDEVIARTSPPLLSNLQYL